MICTHCSAALQDISTVSYNDLLGPYFKCLYCGGVNRIGLLPSKEERKKKIERRVSIDHEMGTSVWTHNRIAKDPIPYWSNDPDRPMDGQMLGTFDISPIDLVQTGKFKLTVWNKDYGKMDYIDKMKKPVHVVDFLRLTPGLDFKSEGVYVYRIEDTDPSVRLSKLVGIISKIDREESTLVINDWNELMSTATKHVRNIIEERSFVKTDMEKKMSKRAKRRAAEIKVRQIVQLTPSDYMARNDIVEWIIRSLCHLVDNNVDVEVMCNWKTQWDNVDGKLVAYDDIMKFNAPRQLAYYVDEVGIPSMQKVLMRKDKATP